VVSPISNDDALSLALKLPPDLPGVSGYSLSEKTNIMIITKTVTVDIVDTAWIVTVSEGKTKVTTRTFTIFHQFKAYIENVLEFNKK